MFTAITAGITIAAVWRYEMAVPLPKGEADADNLLGLSFPIVLVMTGLTAAVLSMVGRRLIEAS